MQCVLKKSIKIVIMIKTCIRCHMRRSRKHENKFCYVIKQLQRLDAPQQRQAIEIASDNFIRDFWIHVKKLKRAHGLKQSLKRKLKRNRVALRKLTNKNVSLKCKRQMLAQRGGFLPLLLAALPAIGSIAGGIISHV